MSRGLSSMQLGVSMFIRGLMVFIITAGLLGCVEPSVTTPISAPSVICTPESSGVNIYREIPKSWANVIFEFALPAIPTPLPPATPTPPNEGQILVARYAAFQQLIKETNRWSDTETITLADSSKIRLTVTFISPSLIQAVFLNHVLKERFIASGFQDQLQNVLNLIAERDELLFLFTVTTTNGNNFTPVKHTVKIPIDRMTLNNSENLKAVPNHDDHNLEQPIDTTSEPVFGYLAYPLAMYSGNQCKWILDPKYNTNIVITVPTIEVDGEGNGQYSWTIPYVSLFGSAMPPEAPNFYLPPDFDINLMTPLALPPNELSNPNYLQDFGRYIWNQITLGSY